MRFRHKVKIFTFFFVVITIYFIFDHLVKTNDLII